MKAWRRLRAKLHKEDGQAMVEFALIAPLLFLILFMIIEVSWLCYGKLSVENLVREAARAGSVCTTAAESRNAAEERIAALTPAHLQDSVDVDINYSDGTDFRQGDIIVNVSAIMEPLTPIPGIIGQNAIRIESECTMKMN
ncbi:MAG: pilus assembly protein [Bacillota bacterium]|nr:pilus assembly protein [Bacillota bacterium]